MKRMTVLRKLLAGLTALAIILGNALAGTYYIDEGDVTVHASDAGQTVTHKSKEEPDDTPVISTKGEGDSANTVTIIADAGTTAEVTFDGVRIDVSNSPNTPAVKTEGEGNVAIELDGENSIKSGENCAGLQKENTGTLTIDDQNEDGGKLEATGGEHGAGIGGGDGKAGTDITVSGGEVTATGGPSGAGIGGGSNGAGKGITISGGEVTATGGESGAGIGGGKIGAGTGITVSGGEVTATGGAASAGIGGGAAEAGTDITISGGEVIATGGIEGAGIGGGFNGNGKNITISGGEVTATGGVNGAGIGGGVSRNGNDIEISGSAHVGASGGDEHGGFGAGAAIGDGGKNGFRNGNEYPNPEKDLSCGSIEYYAPGTSAGDIRDGNAEPEKTTDGACDHSYSTNWSSDSNQHWHQCTSEGCVAKTDVGGHNWVEYGGSAATCTTNEIKAGIKCSVCQKVKQEPQVVPDSALGHAEVVDVAVPATCTGTGLTEGKHCSRCAWKVAQETVPALGHAEVIDAAVPATCTGTGLH